MLQNISDEILSRLLNFTTLDQFNCKGTYLVDKRSMTKRPLVLGNFFPVFHADRVAC